jgi:mono/diheme cytochrome c family protein
MPGPVDAAPPPGRVEHNRGCVRCHEAAAASWNDSLHRRSWSEPDFARARVREPERFCRTCHAPEADPASTPAAAPAEIGVACVTCHVPVRAWLPADGVLAGPTPHTDRTSPHPIVRSDAFAGTAACASCHEFASDRNPELQMQTTVQEHAASAFADRSCQSCHMPQLHHGFAASRDPAMLRAAIVATASRPEPGRVEVTLGLGEVGHAFPTGDPFRRIVVELLAAEDGAWEVVDGEALTRTIGTGRDPGLYRRRTVAHDNRIGAADFTPTLTFDTSHREDTLLRWRVVYERADVTHLDEEPTIFGRIVLSAGELPSQRRENQ